jgi:hypothetical protein
MSSERVAQLIAEKKEKDRRSKVRAELERKLEAAKDALAAERVEKERLMELAEKTRHRLDVISRMAPMLHQDKQRFESFAALKQKNARPAELHSERDFFHSLHEAVKPRRELPLRSSKRTAFTRDYRNGFYLGEREQDAKDEQIARVRSVMEVRNRASSLLAVAAQAKQSPSPAFSEGSAVRFGQGVLSAPEIAEYKNRSCKRTRWYTDYEGRRFLMDSSDMPTVNGVCL